MRGLVALPTVRTHVRIALLLTSIAVSVAAAEIAARRLYPAFQAGSRSDESPDSKSCESIQMFHLQVGWWPRPHLNCMMSGERRVRLKTNSAGFRADHEFAVKKSGTLRVGFFGDSFTFGALVTLEESYPSIIETSVPGLESVNVGIDGGGPDQALLALRHKASGLDLDAIVLAFTAENIARLLMQEQAGWPKPYFTFEGGELRAHNYPLQLMPQRVTSPWALSLRDFLLWQLALAAMRPPALHVGLYRPYAALYDDPTGKLLEQILAQFHREAAGVPLILAPLPTYHYIEYDLSPDYEFLYRRAAQAVGGTYVDVLSAFAPLTRNQKRATRFQFDQHYTPLAHRIVADAMLPHVRALRATR